MLACLSIVLLLKCLKSRGNLKGLLNQSLKQSLSLNKKILLEQDLKRTASDVTIADMENLYIDDPVADDVWLRQYTEKREIKDKENKELTDSFVGNEDLNVWYVHKSNFLCIGPFQIFDEKWLRIRLLLTPRLQD